MMRRNRLGAGAARRRRAHARRLRRLGRRQLTAAKAEREATNATASGGEAPGRKAKAEQIQISDEARTCLKEKGVELPESKPAKADDPPGGRGRQPRRFRTARRRRTSVRRLRSASAGGAGNGETGKAFEECGVELPKGKGNRRRRQKKLQTGGFQEADPGIRRLCPRKRLRAAGTEHLRPRPGVRRIGSRPGRPEVQAGERSLPGQALGRTRSGRVRNDRCEQEGRRRSPLKSRKAGVDTGHVISARRALRSLAGILGCVVALLALPALASASSYTVDSILDQPDQELVDGICKTEANTCTLRAAIEETNVAGGSANTIRFDRQIFDGSGSSATIQPGSPLPAIEAGMAIEGDFGGRCATGAGVTGPCVGVEGSEPFVVHGDGVTISGLAIGAPGSVAVNLGGAEDFTARNDWIGVTLEGNPTLTVVGATVDTESDGATFGGTAVADRNVFGFDGEALVVRGASGTTIAGNYFGVGPDGTTPAQNDRDLAVVDEDDGTPGPEDQATATTIGADVGEAGLETAACDLGCNVFASKTGKATAIDLQGNLGFGELSATGPTAVEGNYVGLDANGNAMAAAANIGIRVGSAGSVTIGGPSAQGHVNGSIGAVSAGGAKDLLVEGNLIGRSLDDGAELFPPIKGVIVSMLGVAVVDQPTIADNSISATHAGIEALSARAEIFDNLIRGAELGIRTEGATQVLSNQIDRNFILDSEKNAILVQDSGNRILRNEVTGSGDSAIVVRPLGTIDLAANLIGGNTSEQENVISGAADYAIELRTTEGSRNEIGRNRGTGNGLGFIVLRPYNGPENDPNGAKRPTIAAAAKTEATGKALPGAHVRVFFKLSPEEGELAGFLGEATADSGGVWKVTYPAAPGETTIVATQTNTQGGTSELSATALTPADPAPPTPTPTPGGGPAAGGSMAAWSSPRAPHRRPRRRSRG